MTAASRAPWNKGMRAIDRWSRREWVPLNPDDPRTRYSFVSGQCHSFAFAMHKLTHWPLFLLCDKSADDKFVDDSGLIDGNPVSWSHVVVLAPDGRFVDVDGAWRLEEGKWYDLVPLCTGTIENTLDIIRHSCDYINVRAAVPFAKIVLNRLDIDLPA